MATEKKSFNFPEDLPSIAEVSSKKDSPYRVILNGQEYLFAMFLESSTPAFGKSGRREIPHNIIDKMVLDDHLLAFKLNGYVEIKNTNYNVTNNIASIINSFTDEKCITKQSLTDYHFESSGTERLYLKFTPLDVFDDVEGEVIPKYTNSEQHLLMFAFFVTKVEDIGRDLLAEKRIRIHFQDVESRSLEMVPINNWDSAKVGNRIGGGKLPEYPQSASDVDTAPIVNRSENEEFIRITRDLVGAPEESGREQLERITRDLVGLPEEPLYNGGYKACRTGEGIYDCLKITFDSLSESIPNLNLNARLPEVYKSQGYSVKRGDVNPSQYKRKKWNLAKSSQPSYDSSPKPFNPYDTWDFGASTSLLYMNSVKKEVTSQSARDILDNHLKYHVSGQKHTSENEIKYDRTWVGLDCDPCILKLNKPRNENAYPYITLRSFDNYFENVVNDHTHSTIFEGWMGEFVFEQDVDIFRETFNNLIKSKVCPDIDAQTTKGDTISAFKFNKMKSKDSTEFINSHQVEYTGNERSYVYLGSDGHYTNVMNYMGEKYLKRFIQPDLYKNSNQGVKLIKVGDTDDIKKDNKNVVKVTNQVPTVPSNIALGRNKLIKYVIFLSDNLTFRVTGNTSYTSGHMLKASLLTNDPNSELSNDMGGFYWVSRVQHIIDFRDKTYANEIVGQKFYKKNMSERQKNAESEPSVSEEASPSLEVGLQESGLELVRDVFGKAIGTRPTGLVVDPQRSQELREVQEIRSFFDSTQSDVSEDISNNRIVIPTSDSLP